MASTIKKGSLVRVVRDSLAESLEAKASDGRFPDYLFQSKGEVVDIKQEYALLKFYVPTPQCLAKTRPTRSSRMKTNLADSFLPCQSLQVAVIGAGNVGRTLTQRIVEKNLADVVLLDIVPGLPQGIALDLMEAQGIERHDSQVIGTNDYAQTKGSDLVIITAGLARKPGMTRDDLINVNAKIVAESAQKALEHSPNALFIVITNPLDVMTYLTWKVTELPPSRVIGMAGVLDSSRLQTFIAMELKVSTADVQAMVLGGHGDLMLPLPRYCTVSGVPITELMEAETINRIVERTRNGGAEIVKLLQTGGAYYAPASSACLMVEAILRNQSRLLPAAAYLTGEYGLNDIFLGVPCRLGCRGVESILEVGLTETETQALHVSAQSVRLSVKVALEGLGLNAIPNSL